MSQDNLPSEKKTFPLDFSPRHIAMVEKFENSGLPGIYSITPKITEKMEKLYVNVGYDYSDVAKMTQSRLEIVLYLAKKYNWAALRAQKMEQDMSGLDIPVSSTTEYYTFKALDKLVKVLSHSIELKSERAALGMVEDDIRALESLTGQTLNNYKSILSLWHSFKNPKKQNMVNVNIPGGAQITRTSDSSVTITPADSESEKVYKEVLKKLAKMDPSGVGEED